MKTHKLVFIFMLLFSSTSYGATLEELQKAALNNRQVVDKYIANLEKEKSNVTLARSGFYPSLDVSFLANQLDQATPFEEKESTQANVTASLNLFAGFKDKYGLKSAKLLRNAEEYKLKGIKQDIQLNVALRYLVIYARKANLQLEEDSYNTLQKLYSDAEQRFKVGIINKNDLLKIKVDLDDAEIIQKKARLELNKSVKLLEREVGLTISLDELTFDEFNRDTAPSVFYHDYEQNMLQSRSEIKVLEEIVQATEMQVKAERGRLYPRVDISSNYTKYDSDYLSSFVGDFDEEIRHQLTVSMNLFDGFGNTSRIKKVKQEERAAKNDLAELKNELITDLKNQFLEYDVNRDNVTVALNSIDQAEENLRIAKLTHSEGLSTTADLLDAVTSLSRAKFNHVAALTELTSNYFRIRRAVDGF